MSAPDTDNKALVLEIQRMSTEDGPGLRTTVFFKGCSLSCRWCHNPESISRRPQIHWVGSSRCIGCTLCINACPERALSMNPSGIVIDRALCRGCGHCVDECPSTSMELLGTQWSLEKLLHEVTKDRAYFDNSGGGVTASGGEPTLQADFVAAFFKELQRQGIHTALDTCGQTGQKALRAILPHTDLVLYDLKVINPERHCHFTGSSNDRILENLLFVRDMMHTSGTPRQLWIRTAIIPETTDRPEIIQEISNFLAQHLAGDVQRWELCAFNNLCIDKYERLGLDWIYDGIPLIWADTMESLSYVARNSGVDPSIVMWSGSTRLDDNDGGDDHRPQPQLRLVKR